MPDHAWFHENLAGYLADGLPAPERERLEQHAAECRECGPALAEQRDFDAALGKLFASAQPAAGLENRVIAHLRAAPLRRRIAWTKTLRWVGAAAAVLLLGVLGYGMNHIAATGSLPFAGDWDGLAQAANNLKQIRMARQLEDARDFDGTPGNYRMVPPGKGDASRNDPFLTVDADPASDKMDTDINYNIDRKATVSVPGAMNLGDAIGIRDGSGTQLWSDNATGEGKPTFRVPVAKRPPAAGEETAPQASGSSKRGQNKDSSFFEPALETRAKAHVLSVTDGESKHKLTVGQNEWAVSPEPKRDSQMMLGAGLGNKKSDPDPSSEGGAARSGVPVTVTISPDGQKVMPGMGPMGGAGARAGGFGGGGGGAAPGGGAPLGGGFGVPLAGPVGGPGYIDAQGGDKRGGGLKAPTEETSTKAPRLDSLNVDAPVDKYYLRITADPTKPAQPSDSKGESKEKGEGKDQSAAPGKSEASYYKITTAGTEHARGKDGKASEVGKLKDEGGTKAGDKAPAAQAPGGQAPGQAAAEQPKVVVRKIIRSGDVEFEIQAFDDAVANVTRLITGIPGAFVATVNSEKLPNGKVRGSVIVRMPPDSLDKFLLDLRKDLAKGGELKSQKIGSQDVTKQYYDLESRLRAARTMEDRLINIIKSGKGEIKDLLAAERELGTWRTKIEEMEGEIRYYNNQVTLSTLNITLYEKEIRAAAAMVISEHVNMKIEADDVEKSLQTALMAVTEAKGRVTKSDMKQHAAGQYEAILQFEVAPAAAGPVKEKLKTLGVVTHHDAQRLQQAEGGSNTLGEIKSRQSDVQFTVTLYNTANIQPREAHILQVATADVAADYRKLQDAVALAKGQVRLGNLDEKDRFNVTAQFDFDVPTQARETIDKLVTGLGDVLTRTASRAAPGETATDRKIGYRLSLRSLANIQARESYVLQVATPDVPIDYRKLQTEILQLKGQVRTQNLNEQDKLNISAQLDFDIPVAEREKFDTLLATMGDVIARNTVRAPANEVASDRKAGYRLTLRNLGNIQPRETYILHVATADVPAEYRRLQEEVVKAKGQLRTIALDEKDKLNTTAQLDFDVPAAERDKTDKLLATLGDIIAKNTVRAAPGETASDRKAGYRLTLRNLANIPARESYVLQVATQDVVGDYRKVQDAIVEAKGQVRAINLDEKDKVNTTAHIDFDVPPGERAKMDKLLTALGEVTARNTLRVAPNEIATDRKTGYRLTLRNIASVLPREIYTLQAVSLDVPANYRKLQDAVAQAKGQVRAGQLNEPDKLNVSATFDFDVPTTEREAIEKLLVEIGEVYSRTTARANPGDVATERKVGFRLTLRSVPSMAPRETIDVALQVTDVELTIGILERLVKDKSGWIRGAPVDQMANGRVEGRLVFDVPLSAKDDIVRKFKFNGNKVLNQKVNLFPEVPETKLTSVHFDVRLSNFGPIVPNDEGLWTQTRTSLFYSFKFLSWSLTFIILGLSVVLPWALVLWVAVKLVKKLRGKTPAPGTTAA